MAATIKDVARDTKLSVATVSNYINGIPVRPENEVKIRESIERLGYRVNHIARGLKVNCSYTLGVIIPFFDDIFHLQKIAAIEEYVSRFGYNLLVCGCRGDHDIMLQKIHFLTEKQVDGIFIDPLLNDDGSAEWEKELQELQIPVIVFDQMLESEYDTILTNNEEVSHKIVEHLISKGHKRIAILSGPNGNYTADKRLAGYESALKEHGIPLSDNLIYRGDFSTKSGRDGFIELFSHKEKPTALFASNYHYTTGALLAAYELGIDINRDLEIFSFDNYEMSHICKPPLSVAVQPINEIGKSGAKLMLKRLQKDYTDFPCIEVLPTEILYN